VQGHHRLLTGRGARAPGSLSSPPHAYHGFVQRAYLASTRALSAALVLVGVAMVVAALARGGGALALGVVVGALFAVLGVLRLRLARDRGR
jgi:hypothetical protein